MKSPTFDEVIRAVLLLGALVSVAVLAVWFRSEAAGGALIGLLGVGTSYLFRSKMVSPQSPAPKTGETP